METHTIDAQGKKLGRVATEAANVLRGKDTPDFAPNKLGNKRVKIINASKIDISEKKMDELYTRYSGYPGGLKYESRGHLVERKGYEPVFRHAVRGMIPSNKLRDQLMKRLEIIE